MAAKEEFNGVAWLLSSGSFSDLEIHCETQVFKVHRAILATNSEYFHKLLKSNMTESAACSINFPDDKPHIIARLLEFLYTSNISTDTEPDVAGYSHQPVVFGSGSKRYGIWASEYDEMELEVHLFAAADKYGVVKMQNFSRLRFLRAYIALFRRFNSLPNTTAHDEWDRHGELVLGLTRAIYSSTPNTQKMLRDIVIRTIQKSIEPPEPSKRCLRTKDIESLIAQDTDMDRQLARAGAAWSLGTGQYSDFEIHCGKHSSKVHRAVLASNSAYLRNKLKSTTAESLSQMMPFPEDEDHIMARLIHFLYTSNYITDNISTSKEIAFHGISDLEDPLNTQYGRFNQTSDTLMLHTKVYAIADKFNLAAMKEESRRHFLQSLSAWKTMGMTSTPDHGEGWLLLRDLIQLVYQTMPSADYGLRDFMIVFAHSVAERTHRDTVAQNSDFALDLVNRKLAVAVWRCTGCQAPGRVFESLCEHYWRDCAIEACKDRIEAQTWCLDCGAFGTMRPTELNVKLCLT